VTERKVNDRPTDFPMSDYEHWMLENAKDTPWTENGGKAIIRDLVDLADRAVDSAAEITRLREQLRIARECLEPMSNASLTTRRMRQAARETLARIEQEARNDLS